MLKMIAINALALCVLCASFVMSMPADKYTTKYDSVDVDEILKNERLLSGYAKCLLDEGKCTPDGSELKKVLPEALKTECAKCNDKQKTSSKKVLTFLLENKPDIYEKLENKYDPSGEYKKKYCEVAKKEDIKVTKC